jgi:hypothetical protein
VLLEQRAAGRVEAWILGDVAAHVKPIVWVGARKEEARVAVERAEND